MKLLKGSIPFFLVFLFFGCSKNIQTNEAVREAVIKHLSNNKGLSLSAMDIDVSTVTFKDNQAEAMVSFKPKGSAASTGMQMRYTLTRKGNEWVVDKKNDSGGGHSQTAMPAEGSMPPAGAMPQGHPPAGGTKQ